MMIIRKIFFVVIMLTAVEAFAGKAPKSFVSLDHLYDLKIDKSYNGKPLVIFSSREYISDILKQFRTDKPSGFYWVLPVQSVTPEGVNDYVMYLSKKGLKADLKSSAEGAAGTVNDIPLYIFTKSTIAMLTAKKPRVLVDVDYFFRSYSNDVKTPKMYLVFETFKIIDELDLDAETIILIKSLDISLPHWTQEFALGSAKTYKAWKKNQAPNTVLVLDTLDQYINNFAQYEEAYQMMKDIEKEQSDNPFFYKRMFIACLKLYMDNELIRAAKKAYSLDREMLELYFEGADYLVGKQEIYPAYLLLKEGLKSEPWNSKLRTKAAQIIELGLSYYGQDKGNKELSDFFEKEKEKLSKGTLQ